MIRIICLTEVGLQLARRLQHLLDSASTPINSDVCYKPTPFKEHIQSYFTQGDILIFICATGIVMRTLAPVIKDKYNDPAVLVLDEQGQFVIPLLSGHEGGANELARQVSELLENQLVLTTANSYLKPKYVVGMGCERHCPEQVLQGLLAECLVKVGLTIDDISAITSIDIKSDEVGLIGLAETLQKPYLTFDAKTLSTMEGRLSTKSDYILKTVGVYGVAESAALYQAQQLTNNGSELLLNKHKNKQATCAIARSYSL
ncbi:cobalamin biosynthesis protein CbiG [Psychromonas sp. B3M02]|uniref:cobalt-precorrin 5A hydrolase n=1 Tax=Psychromonas sp. B3M02 TaxID=2267226 RepID=UPI000DEB1A5F|nr:cobalamin biosynthesis protein [Psychromonas sp. B3M02]RBW43905.1 cobalamin biosynthesis protein CbiG [Psychromonas sp. B3M02]